MNHPIIIRPVTPDDAEALLAIYNWAVDHTTATFATTPRTPDEQANWLAQHSAPPHSAIVATDPESGAVLGYASLSSYNPRQGYRFTAETSVYIHPDWHGNGIGTALLAALVALADEHGLVALLGFITSDNAASVRLHQRFGFTEIGLERSVGYKFGQWVDVAILERVNDANRDRVSEP